MDEKLQDLNEAQLISVLSEIAKGCTFEVIIGENPYNRVVYETPHIWIMEFGRPFVVDLNAINMTAKEWLIAEIERLQTDMPALAQLIIDLDLHVVKFSEIEED